MSLCLLPWTVDVPGQLWSRTQPLEAFIALNNGAYTLTCGTNPPVVFVETDFATADIDYQMWATRTVSNQYLPQYTPQLPQLVLPPSSGQQVIVTVAGSGDPGAGYFAVGTWTGSGVSVSSRVIPTNQITVWSSVPTIS